MNLHKLSILEAGSPEYGVTRNLFGLVYVFALGVSVSKDNLELRLELRKCLNLYSPLFRRHKGPYR